MENPKVKAPWAVRLHVERARRAMNRSELAVRMRAAARALNFTELPEIPHVRTYSRRWEAGAVVPSWRYQALYAAVFGLGVRELFGDVTALDFPPSLLTTLGGTVEVPHYSRAEDSAMHRRAFVAWLTALAAGSTALPDSVRRVIAMTGEQPELLRSITIQDVTNLETSNRLFVTWQHATGGGLSRKAVIGQLSWAVDQLDARVPGTPEALDAWRTSTARLADTAGMMAHDAGREQQARSLLILGYRIATSIGDPTVSEPAQAHLLANLARQAIEIGRPKTGLELARQAGSVADNAAPTTLTKMHAIKARAYASLGDARAVERELGLAEQEFGRIEGPDSGRVQMGWCWRTEGQRHYNNGTAWQLLTRANPELLDDRTVEAITTAFTTSADSWGEGEQRTATSARLRAATTLVANGGPSEAVDIAREALPTLPDLRSERIRNDVQHLLRACAPYRRRDDVGWLANELTPFTT